MFGSIDSDQPLSAKHSSKPPKCTNQPLGPITSGDSEVERLYEGHTKGIIHDQLRTRPLHFELRPPVSQLVISVEESKIIYCNNYTAVFFYTPQ
jgi:hypothetical protein